MDKICEFSGLILFPWMLLYLSLRFYYVHFILWPYKLSSFFKLSFPVAQWSCKNRAFIFACARKMISFLTFCDFERNVAWLLSYKMWCRAWFVHETRWFCSPVWGRDKQCMNGWIGSCQVGIASHPSILLCTAGCEAAAVKFHAARHTELAWLFN